MTIREPVLAFVLAFFTAVPVSAKEPINLMTPPFVCVSLRDTQKLRELVHDSVAWVKYSRLKEQAGECGYFTAGGRMYRDKQIGDYSCLRKEGDIECYWALLTVTEQKMFEP